MITLRTGITLIVATFALALTSVTGAGAATRIVMSGLDNPRGLAFGPQGALYVAEAGRGGPGPCIVLRGAPQCYGPTGAVSRLWHGRAGARCDRLAVLRQRSSGHRAARHLVPGPRRSAT